VRRFYARFRHVAPVTKLTTQIPKEGTMVFEEKKA